MRHLFSHSIGSLALLTLLCAGIFSSCKDEDPVVTPLQTPSGEVYAATVSSLTFHWESVRNATQYGYELKDSEGNVVAGDVTSGTTATITGLKDNSTYTLDVWAYSEYGSEYSRSSVATLTGTTPAIVQLGTPAPVATVENGVLITWEAIPNASGYSYQCVSDNGSDISGTTADTQVTLNSLNTGFYTVSVKAVSEDEAFSDSEYGSATFEIEKKEAWRTDGTFDDGAGNTWPVTMIAWNNGTYTLKDWYNVEGYDLEFSVNDDTSINVLNYYEPYLPSIWVQTGAEEDNGWIEIYTATDGSNFYSSFAGSKSEGGSVWFYSYKTSGYAEFSWNPGGASLIDEIVGTYTQYATGTDYTGVVADNAAFTATNDVTITKTGDNTIEMTGFFAEGTVLTATIDESARTLTFDISLWLDYYYFSAAGDVTAPVVATIAEDGTITFTGWSAMYEYSGVYYDYVTDTQTTLTKK